MGEVGLLQVKVIKANDLAATDLNGNTKQQLTSLYMIVAFFFYIKKITVSLCLLQEKATPFVLSSSVTANFRVTQFTRLLIQSGAKPLHCE